MKIINKSKEEINVCNKKLLVFWWASCKKKYSIMCNFNFKQIFEGIDESLSLSNY